MKMSEHLSLEIAAAFRSGHQSAEMPPALILHEQVADCTPRLRHFFLDLFTTPSALAPGQPVPGCGCDSCTGLSGGIALLKAQRRGWGDRSNEWAAMVERARQVTPTEVLHRLGIEPPRRGKLVRCPLHEERTPSFSVDDSKGWYCFGCGAKGGDGLELWRQVRHLTFAEAVRELAA
jgi:hypothetical protein